MPQIQLGKPYGPKHTARVNVETALRNVRFAIGKVSIPLPVDSAISMISNVAGDIPVAVYTCLASQTIQLTDSSISFWAGYAKTVNLIGFAPTPTAMYERMCIDAQRMLSTLRQEAVLASALEPLQPPQQHQLLVDCIEGVTTSMTLTGAVPTTTTNNVSAQTGFNLLASSMVARGLVVTLNDARAFILGRLIAQGEPNTPNLANLVSGIVDNICVLAAQANDSFFRMKGSAWGDFLRKRADLNVNFEIRDFSWEYLVDLATEATRVMRIFAHRRDVPSLISASNSIFNSSGHFESTTPSSGRLGMLFNLAKQLREVARNTDVNRSIPTKLSDAMGNFGAPFATYRPPFDFNVINMNAPFVVVTGPDTVFGPPVAGTRSTMNMTNVSKLHLLGGLQWLINTLAGAYGMAIPPDIFTAVQTRLNHGMMDRAPRFSAISSYASSLSNMVVPEATYLKDLFMECLVSAAFFPQDASFSSETIGYLDATQKKDIPWLDMLENLQVFDIVIQAFRDTVAIVLDLIGCPSVGNSSPLLTRLVIKDWFALINETVAQDSSGRTATVGMQRCSQWFTGSSSNLPDVNNVIDSHVNEMRAFVVRSGNENEVFTFSDGKADAVSVFYSTMNNSQDFETLISHLEVEVAEQEMLFPAFHTFGADVFQVKAVAAVGGNSTLDRIYVMDAITSVLSNFNLTALTVSNVINSLGHSLNYSGMKGHLRMDATTASLFERALVTASQAQGLTPAEQAALVNAVNRNAFFVCEKDQLFFVYENSMRVMSDLDTGERSSILDWAQKGNVTSYSVPYPPFVQLSRPSLLMKLTQIGLAPKGEKGSKSKADSVDDALVPTPSATATDSAATATNPLEGEATLTV